MTSRHTDMLRTALQSIADLVADAVDKKIRTGRLPPLGALLSEIEDTARTALADSESDDLETCETCKGRRFYTVHTPSNEGVPESDADDQPCPDCNPNGEGVAP